MRLEDCEQLVRGLGVLHPLMKGRISVSACGKANNSRELATLLWRRSRPEFHDLGGGRVLDGSAHDCASE